MAWRTFGTSRGSDQFDWFSAYLNDRELQTTWRAATFGCTVLLATLPIAMIWSPSGPDTRLTRTVCLAAAGLGAISGLLWLVRWPTRRQSVLFSQVSTVAIAAACLSLSNPYPGLAGCTTFAIIGGFVAYFHTLNEVVLNFAVAAVCSAVLTVRLIAATGDIALAGAAVITVAVLNVGVPFGIHSLVHTLRSDLRLSSLDPLTGLHNRRSFRQSVYELMTRPRSESVHLVVTMIDLDRFKQLNDTHGHAAGDTALIHVSAALEQNSRRTAIIGRAGGEEFLIADVARHPEPANTAERLRQAIADIPAGLTASIGTASTLLDDRSAIPTMQLIDDLIKAADTAMYRAKRAGGNQVCHFTEAPPIA
ncbi:GGDEF domain-containing protein [Mycolicibacterium sp. CH28]|uniref:GGDEF domain-containing protein n=1 Tax=Mycolicibacterium sp. CH28 TaxID=2512237 RepID=UPI001080C894|nr:GGDEF domain-containing protein [Mycolicibacterium sp. CH28]TGD84707.1 GGDEF domain-containing protein [Mycolicibacterium sp. CH28]